MSTPSKSPEQDRETPASMAEPKVVTSAVRLSPTLHAQLKEEAARRHTGMSTLIREAVAHMLEESKLRKMREERAIQAEMEAEPEPDAQSDGLGKDAEILLLKWQLLQNRMKGGTLSSGSNVDMDKVLQALQGHETTLEAFAKQEQELKLKERVNRLIEQTNADNPDREIRAKARMVEA